MGLVGIVGAVLIVFVILMIIYFKWFTIIVEPSTAVIIERFGSFLRKCEGEWVFLIPFVDRPRYIVWRYVESNRTHSGTVSKYVEHKTFSIDLRQVLFDLPIQPIITRDNVEIFVHPMMRYEICDPVRVAYETVDLMLCVERLVQTTLRSVIGDMGLDDTLASRAEIEKLITTKISKVCQDWGLSIKGVDLLEIDPTPSILEAMYEQIRAERYRRTQKVTAEGYAEKVRLQAEGSCQVMKATSYGDAESIKLVSKGTADARLIVAQQRAEAIRLVANALKGISVDPTQYLIGIQYITALRTLATANSAHCYLYVPLETDISGAAGRF
ncbi:hypothetical protein WA158_000462 [Blastocystis sp. Blastoise]